MRIAELSSAGIFLVVRMTDDNARDMDRYNNVLPWFKTLTLQKMDDLKCMVCPDANLVIYGWSHNVGVLNLFAWSILVAYRI